MVVPFADMAGSRRSLALDGPKMDSSRTRPKGRQVMTRFLRRGHLLAWCVLTPLIIGVLISAVVRRSRADSQLSGPIRQDLSTQGSRP